MSDQIIVVLCTLSGGGDTQLFLLPKLAYDWAMQVSPGTMVLPPDVSVALQPFLDPMVRDLEDELGITLSTAQNDAMLDLGLRVENYEGIQDMILVAQSKGWKLSDKEYHGSIY